MARNGSHKEYLQSDPVAVAEKRARMDAERQQEIETCETENSQSANTAVVPAESNSVDLTVV